MKTCNKCNEEISLSSFYRDKRRSDGHQSSCKECTDDRKRLRLGAKRREPLFVPTEDEISNNRKRYANKSRSRRLLERYGLTQEGWDELLISQNGCCAICLTDQPGTRGWQTDHNHTTGQVRGILCLTCNIVVGHVENGWPIIVPAIEEYLKKHS